MPAAAERATSGTGGPEGRIARLGRSAQTRWQAAGLLEKAVSAAALLVVVLLALMVVKLPWAGDLGIHAATLDRLRHDLGNPGDPLVKADVDSPYYSPWMLFLALIGKVTGATTFQVLHLAAAINLVLLVTGIRQFVRTLTSRRAAVPLAILCVTLLYGWELFTWSGFPGATSLALCIAYPSTFAMGVAFHLWAMLRTALARDWGMARYLMLGALLAVVALSHQFTGVVTVFGLLAILLGARPWPGRAAWLRIGAAIALSLAILLVWPYYSFFSLLNVGGLEEIHRPLYDHLVSRFGLLSLGIVALALRFRRDRRDPLVLFFAFGALVYALGGLTQHWSYGRVLPAVFISAQVALAVELAGEAGRRARRVLVPLTALALLVGCWSQVGALNYVASTKSVPVLGSAPAQHEWGGYQWITKHVKYGQVIMTKDYFALRQAPAYGPYTVASGYPDFFLKDEAQRSKDTKKFFEKGTSRAQRLALLHKYHVRWVIQFRSDGGFAPGDPALKKVAKGPNGELLLKVV
ncbi:hypothetical protein [Streptomyces sp. RPT161]|uniref:hypothetical protein n=1 Tax=Streptomyces sp. RPT161 TaxID=3015993 RepID=UPI002FD2F6E2